MPTYRYQCSTGHSLERFCTIAEMGEFERTAPLCACGETLQRDMRMGRHIKFFEALYEHASDEPVFCSSAQQLADLCRKNGNRSEYLADMGGLFGVKEGRQI